MLIVRCTQCLGVIRWNNRPGDRLADLRSGCCQAPCQGTNAGGDQDPGIARLTCDVVVVYPDGYRGKVTRRQLQLLDSGAVKVGWKTYLWPGDIWRSPAGSWRCLHFMGDDPGDRARDVGSYLQVRESQYVDLLARARRTPAAPDADQTILPGFEELVEEPTHATH